MKRIKDIIENESFLKNVSKLLSASFLVQVFAFALSPIISRLYSASDFGHLAIFASIAGFFIILATARFELALILPEKDEDANALVKLSFLINIFVSLSSFIFVYFFRNEISTYYKTDFSLIWVYMLPFVVFFSASFFILINYNNRLKNYNKQAGAQTILGVGNPIATISLAVENGLNFGMIKAILVANFLASMYMLPSLIKNKVFKTKTKISKVLKKYYRFPLFNLPHAIINFISNSLPVFILTPAFGDITIGLVTMALGKVFRPINMFGSSIYQVLSKKIVDDISTKKPVVKKVFKLLVIQVFIGIVPFVILYIFAPQIFSFVWGADWHLSGVYIRYLLPWLFFVYLTSSVSFIPNVLKEQKGALLIEIVYLAMRFLALSYGVKTNSIETALILYSAVGVIMLCITLIWYFIILKKNETI